MRLVKLRILRTPGIRDAFTLEPAAGLNLVTGPNGIGKSTICRTVLALLWPGAHGAHDNKPFEAAAEFRMQGRTLTVEKQDLDSPVWSGALPDLGPDHLAIRYRLGVLDLLQPASDDDPLAKEIRRHMTGGFDLDGVRDRFFDFKKGQTESRTLKSANGQVADRLAHQRSLTADQVDLEELKQKRNLGRQARDRLTILAKLQELAERKTQQTDALARLADLPSGTRQVRDEDPANLEDFRHKENKLVHRMEKLISTLAATEKEMADLESSGNGTTDPPLDLLKKKLRTLMQLGHEIRQAERDANDPRILEFLTDTPAKQGVFPFILAVAGGAAFLAAGLFFPTAGALRMIFLVTGGGLTGAGLLGLAIRPRNSDHGALVRDKQIEMARKKDHLATCLRQQEEALAAFNATLDQSGVQPVTGGEEAEQLLEDLAQRQERIREFHSTRDRDRGFLDRDKDDLEGLRAEIGAMFDRLGLAPGRDSDPEVSHLLDLKPRFDQALSDQNNACRDIARLETEIEADRACLKDGETTEPPAGELGRLIERETVLAREFEDLQKTITTIETRISVAMASHDLEQAAAEAGAARSALEGVRQFNREAALGRLLLNRVTDEHELRSRPVVLASAMEYFSIFTGHRYELKMASQGDGLERWLAVAEDSIQPLDLHELSDGTRAQLLLAVKLAFITAGEKGARPPIFLDDSLTSADPERFAAVARSLGRLAEEEKRQIFYLTPNPADAAAFQRALDGAKLPAAHHIDLAEVRGLAGAADPALFDPANLPADIMVPDPATMTAAQFAETLLVPQPDPWARQGALHVFFLLDDNLDLVRRLVDGNAPTLTRFEMGKDTLLATGEITEDEAQVMEARGKFWKAWLDGWRIGRARPVTREFLAASPAVSRTYLDRVAEALAECDGDGACLVAALDEGKVKGFRSNKRDQLRQELEEAELLDARSRLTHDELLTHTRDRVAPLLASNILDMQKVRTLALTFARLVGSEDPAKSPSSSPPSS
jgi:energy-coupling factor transporter ATP-binding protein EcfA2